MLLLKSTKWLHLLRQSNIPRHNPLIPYSKYSVLCESALSRGSPNSFDFIPDPPPIPQFIPEPVEHVVHELNALGEPTLHSLGLGSWWPNGLVQTGLEHLHVGLDIPWWSSIVIGTIILRICTFPLVILAQRNAANQQNHMPVVQHLHKKFTAAQKAGDLLEASRNASALMAFTKENNVKPIRGLITPFIQMPIFISVFVGIRQMANLPVESMTTGGTAWFIDLTTSDPYFLLPVITMATFFVTLEVGVDGVRAKTLSPTVRTMMRVLPLIIFPFTINFPSNLLLYWCTSNLISLLQVILLRIKGAKKLFKIPEYVVHDPAILPEKQPFIKQFKETWKNSRKVLSVEEQMRQESIKFKEAGMGAIKKTYDYDPTKVKKTN